MKKILAIAVACMYLAITSGLVLQVHYCMGKQVGSTVKFAETATHSCSKCGMENAKNKCCHDDVKFVKLQDVHQQGAADYQFNSPEAMARPFDFINSLLLYNNNESECITDNAPPDDDTGQPSLFLLNSVFRI